MAFERGETGVIVPFPDVGPGIDRLRQRHDPSAALGAPAHVTVTFPFFPAAALTDDDLLFLAIVAADQPAFSVTFASRAGFPASAI